MNLWSMNDSGADLRPLTQHRGWDIKGATLSEGHIVYQVGADLHHYDIAAQRDAIIPIRLASDLDHQREKWVRRPLDYLTSAHLSTNGDRLVFTARGHVFTAPAGQGRFVDVTRSAAVRYRQARFLPDNRSLLALGDESGELEFVKLPANGVGGPERLTTDGKVFREEGVPSPDGQWLAYHDKNQELWLFHFSTKKTLLIATSKNGEFEDLAWSPDSQWLAYVRPADNAYSQLWLYRVTADRVVPVTSDRVNSFSPAWTPDGKWLYFLSDRQLESLVSSPWGTRQPEPFFDKTVKLYAVALQRDTRSPFEPNDELHPADAKKEGTPDKPKKGAPASATGTAAATNGVAAASAAKPTPAAAPRAVSIDLEGVADRVMEVPVAAGNYSGLSATDKQIYWFARDSVPPRKRHLMTLTIGNDSPKPKTLVEDVGSYELSLDGKKLMIRKGNAFYVIDSGASAPAKLEKAVDLGGWTFSLDPRQEWRQMFVESWRLMRDYFYDPHMHGVDWAAMLQKYLPLVSRVTDRAELSDLMSDLVGELSALHIFVRGGDHREGTDQVQISSLGARWERDPERGGYRIERVYRSDPDYPERAARPARPARSGHRRGGCHRVHQRDSDTLRTSAGGAAAQSSRQTGPRPRARPRGGGVSGRDCHPDLDQPGSGTALRGLGVLAPSARGGEGPGTDRLRASARHGGQRHRPVGAGLLSRVQPARPDRGRAAQPGREYR